MNLDEWCKSGQTPIMAGTYTLTDGTVVEVVRARSGKFYAKREGKYVRGLIWRLRGELESQTRGTITYTQAQKIARQATSVGVPLEPWQIQLIAAHYSTQESERRD